MVGKNWIFRQQHSRRERRWSQLFSSCYLCRFE